VLWERSVTEQRSSAVLEVLEAGLPVTEVADRYGVSRQSVHTWIARYRAGGLEGLADRSHRPNRCPHQLAAAVEARVCELRRRHPGWGRSGFGTSWSGEGHAPAQPRNRLISPGGRRRKRRTGGGNGHGRWSCGSWTWWRSRLPTAPRSRC
jgi:hypothetical protein